MTVSDPVRVVDGVVTIESGVVTIGGQPVEVATPTGQPLEVVSPELSVATACSGQITVAASGTAVQGPSSTNDGGFWLKGHPANTDSVWVGNDGAGDVSNANGFPLDPGEMILVHVTNLNNLWFDASVNGEKICWHRA